MRTVKNTIIIIISLLFSINLTQYAHSQELKLTPNPLISDPVIVENNTQILQGNTTVSPEQTIFANTTANITGNTTQQMNLPEEITLCQSQEQTPIDLEQSLATSLENNLGIKIVTTQKNRDKWLYYNSLTEFLPDVSLNLNQTWFSGTFLIGGVIPAPGTLIPSGRVFHTVTAGVTVDWVGFNGFGRYFNAKAAKSVYRATKRNLDLTRDQVLLQTTSQYYSLLQNKLNTEILTRALEQTQAQLTLNQQRFAAGVGTRFDVLRAESQVASARQNLISAYNNLKFSQAQLANTLGVDLFTPLVPDQNEAIAKTLFKDCFDLNKVTQIALVNKPELDIARLNIEATRARRNSGYSIYFPSVAMSTSANGIGTRADNLSSSKSISLLINWQGGQGLGLTGLSGIKELNEQVKESKLRLVDTQRTVEQSLITSYYNILTSRELILASQAQVTSAEESLRLALVRLQAGVGIYTDVIDAQLTETQSRINYLNALTSYNVAQAQLLYDMGVISSANLLNGVCMEELAPKNNKKK